jgi:hypothetical protein
MPRLGLAGALASPPCFPVGEPADLRVVQVRDPQMHLARALVLAARLDLGHHLGRYLLGSHGVGVVVAGDAHRSRVRDPPWPAS